MTTWINRGFVEKFSQPDKTNEFSMAYVLQTTNKEIDRLHKKYIESFDTHIEGFAAKKKSKSSEKSEKTSKKSEKTSDTKSDPLLEEANAKKKEAQENVDDTKDKIKTAEKEIDAANEDIKEANKELAEYKQDLDDAKKEINKIKESDKENSLVDEAGNDDDDTTTEAFKNKSKSKSKTKSKPKSQASQTNPLGISNNDYNVIKQIFDSMFAIGFAYLVAHIWYSNFFENTINVNLKEKYTNYEVDGPINAILMYFVLVIDKIHNFFIKTIPDFSSNWYVAKYLGRRFWFFALFLVFYNYAPIFQDILEALLKNIVFAFNLFQSWMDGKIEGKLIAQNLFKRFIDQIMGINFSAFTGVIGFIYFSVFISNILFDDTKSFFYNVGNAPSVFSKFLTGSVFYIIYLVFKFAIIYQPVVAATGAAMFLGFLYYTFIYNDNLTSLFNLIDKNHTKIHKDSVLFQTYDLNCDDGSIKNKLDKLIKFLFQHAHHLLFLYFIGINAMRLTEIQSLPLMVGLIVAGIAIVFAIVKFALQMYNIDITVGGTSVDTSSQTSSQIPSQTSSQTPSQTSSQTSVKSPLDTFVKTPIEILAQTSNNTNYTNNNLNPK
jgi:hypothetical protein